MKLFKKIHSNIYSIGWNLTNKSYKVLLLTSLAPGSLVKGLHV